MSSVDLITLELVQEYLVSTVREMRATMIMTAHSSIIYEGHERMADVVKPAKVNIHGGAVAMGHPIGASGAAVLVKLVYAMVDRGARRGIAALCLGGGSAVALAVELV